MVSISLSELKNRYFWRDVFAEFFATMLFIYMVTSVLTKLQPGHDIVQISFGIGISVAILVQVFGPICGSHLNPAVSLTAFLTGHVTLVRAFVYTIVQLLGGIAGSALTYGVTPDSTGEKYGVVRKSEDLTAGQGMVCEMILTMMLLLTILASVSKDHGRKNFGYANAMAIGESVVVTHLIGVKYSGASINPCRALGPSVVTGDFPSYHWIYYVGPYLASVISALLYRFIFAKEESKKDKSNDIDMEEVPLKNAS